MPSRPEIIRKDDVLDLTNRMRVKPHKATESKDTIAKQYKKLSPERDNFLHRARKFSQYTIPYLYPEHHNSTGNYGDGTNTTGWQSFGSECVTNLANRMVLTLFPPHTTFARLELTPAAKQILMEAETSVVQQESMLSGAEKSAMLEHERIAGRVALGEGLTHLMVGGNTCIYAPKDGNVVNYPLSRYVVKRDKSGNLLQLITEEEKAIETFEPALQMMIRAKLKERGTINGSVSGSSQENSVKLFTSAKMVEGFYHIEQEVCEMRVGKSYRVKPENFPFIVLRWSSNYGEAYGRSLVELHAADFHVIQLLSEAIAKGMVLMSDIKYLVKPGSVTDIDHLIESPTGEFVYGNADDIGVLQIEKQADFTSIASVLDKYERRVGRAFLLGSATQRNAERVTAYEIRRDHLEMEQALGGSYSLLANTLQRPYFNLLLNRIDFGLPEHLYNTILITGIEALSKMTDADKFVQWTESMVAAAQLPPQVQDRMKWGDFAQHQANQLSLDLPYMMSEDEYRDYSREKAQQQQQQMLAEGAAASMPQVANNMTKGGQ